MTSWLCSEEHGKPKDMSDRHHLPRLERMHYQSFATVYWTFHFQFRELLVHALHARKSFLPRLLPDA